MIDEAAAQATSSSIRARSIGFFLFRAREKAVRMPAAGSRPFFSVCLDTRPKKIIIQSESAME